MQRTRYQQAPSYRSRSLRGAMGDLNCDQDGNCYDDSTGDYTPATQSPYNNVALDSTGTYTMPAGSGTGPTFGVSSGPSTTASLWQTIVNDAAAVAAPIVKSATQQAPYFITNPATGQSVLYNPNTGGSAVGTSALASINPTYLIIGVIAVVALGAAGKKG